ncbi:hypothetical protein OsJ_14928 [Oryza sativa Japonica Group]|uniref:Uncharacterized protein n=1 Tax=Oryza sativa subsp. japonica TaxID=39947 RepID=A3AU67_ORYSJ|nr:hypothetical protein OsJ_14928 [Oryza sativa Japonica Group]
MSALAVGDADGGVVSPGGGLQASPTVVVDGDVVLSGVVLVLVALAFVFVMHHFLAAMRRRDSDAGSSSASSGRQRGGRGVMAGVVGIDAAKAGGQGGVDPAVLRALPVTGAVVTTTTSAAASSSGGDEAAAAVLVVVEVPGTTTTKPQGDSARVGGSLRRMWSRGALPRT